MDSNQITRAYFDSIGMEARYLDSVVPDLSMNLYGKNFSSPVMIAAFSHLGKTYPGGMVEMARGAQAAGVCNWAGMGSEEQLGQILEACPGSIKIIKPYADRNRIVSMIHYAQEHGALAVGIDIDHSFGKNGYADVVLGEVMEPITINELKSLTSQTDLPFIIKGVLSVQDACKCVQAGVKGLLLSHHHGIMKSAVPPLMLIRHIKNAVGNAADLFVDCGIETGEDAYKALALGAKAVCVGRSILPAFAEKGAEGVKQELETIHGSLRAMMARTCAKDLEHIPNDVLWNLTTGQKL